MVGAVETQRPVAERRIDERAMVGPLRVGMDVRTEEPARAAHAGDRDLAALLQLSDQRGETAHERSLIIGRQRVDGCQQTVGPLGGLRVQPVAR